MRLAPIAFGLAAAASLVLSACQRGSGDGEASERAVEAAGGSAANPTASDASTGAAGAATSSADPNPAGTGATAGATPNDPSGSMGATSPIPPPAPGQATPPPQ